jgi:hypothetical protein
MRKAIVLAAVVAGAMMALSATPSSANGGGYWHDRLTASCSLHYQYVNAGYPARGYEGEVVYTYFPGDVCCGYRRHWPWMGRYHHGYRYWPWYGRRHHHHW